MTISFLKLLKNQYLLLVLIVALGFAARLYKIDNPIADWHSWRQSDTAAVTRIYIDRGIDILHPRYYDISFLQSGKPNPQGLRFVEFPIFNVVHLFLVSLVPQFSFETVGRLVSVFSSLVSIVLLFFLGRRFLDVAGGLLAAFFAAAMPFNIYFSRVILPEPMAVTFALASLWAFVLWFDRGKSIFIVLSGILFACALLVKPYTIFYAIPMFWMAGLAFQWNWRKMLKSKQLWLFAGLAFIPVLAWRVWMLKYPEGIPFYSWAFNSDGIRFKPSFWRWIFGERLGKMMLGGWGTFLFVAGLLAKARPQERGVLLVLAFACVSFVSVVASANVRHDYYQTLVVPGVCIILARGVVFLWNTDALPRLATRLAVLVTIAWTIVFPFYEIREFYKINHPEIIRAGEALDKIASKDALVVAPYNGDTAFLYQTKRQGWPYMTNSIEELVQAGADYFVSVNLNDPQTQDVMRKFEIPVQTEEYVVVNLSKKRLPKN